METCGQPGVLDQETGTIDEFRKSRECAIHIVIQNTRAKSYDGDGIMYSFAGSTPLSLRKDCDLEEIISTCL